MCLRQTWLKLAIATTTTASRYRNMEFRMCGGSHGIVEGEDERRETKKKREREGEGEEERDGFEVGERD